METGDDLRVPKLTSTVLLATVGDRRGGRGTDNDPANEGEEVQVFVSEQRTQSFDRQRVVDVLENGERFLPVQTVDGYVVVNKDVILWAAIDLIDGEMPVEEVGEGVLAGETQEAVFDVRREVDVELTNESSLSGALMYSPPSRASRPVDHLNLPERFVTMYTETRVYLINKDHIVRVSERASESENHGES